MRKVKALRLQFGWSQSDLADMAGVSLRTVQRIETAGQGSPESLQALASVLEVENYRTLLQECEQSLSEKDKSDHVADYSFQQDEALQSYIIHVLVFLLAAFVFSTLKYAVGLNQNEKIVLALTGWAIWIIVEGNCILNSRKHSIAELVSKMFNKFTGSE